ncbi:hypothetical protein LR48_Vigan04g109100 [Vigna angularis]|uniref:Uncharacterized protein n=1 Tax=Phaseolus angularis TaxID=3914 RepID=A0A0L9UDR2_PHAAN|nr:hypothetical protein LR48_Vigan04g109100 [Vigna angularis]
MKKLADSKRRDLKFEQSHHVEGKKQHTHEKLGSCKVKRDTAMAAAHAALEEEDVEHKALEEGEPSSRRGFTVQQLEAGVATCSKAKERSTRERRERSSCTSTRPPSSLTVHHHPARLHHHQQPRKQREATKRRSVWTAAQPATSRAWEALTVHVKKQ